MNAAMIIHASLRPTTPYAWIPGSKTSGDYSCPPRAGLAKEPGHVLDHFRMWRWLAARRSLADFDMGNPFTEAGVRSCFCIVSKLTTLTSCRDYHVAVTVSGKYITDRNMPCPHSPCCPLKFPCPREISRRCSHIPVTSFVL